MTVLSSCVRKLCTKLKIKIFQRWVQDLTEQNLFLITNFEEQEKRLKQFNMHKCNNCDNLVKEERVTKKPDEAANQDVKTAEKQSSSKENLVAKKLIHIEELRNLLEKQTLEASFTTKDLSRGCNESDQDHVKKKLECRHCCHLSELEKEVIQLKKKLKESECNTKCLHGDLVVSDQNARDMRAALTAEVAEKHDHVVALRREVAQLEEQLRQADMQTHFKDDIIKGLRKEVKVARSKETLVEVLGIKDRALCHMEVMEQKEVALQGLRAQLRHCQEAGTRVLHQLDWCTENISQQCVQANVPEEFKKCILTMMDELRESIECCNLSPTNPIESSKVR